MLRQTKIRQLDGHVVGRRDVRLQEYVLRLDITVKKVKAMHMSDSMKQLKAYRAHVGLGKRNGALAGERLEIAAREQLKNNMNLVFRVEDKLLTLDNMAVRDLA